MATTHPDRILLHCPEITLKGKNEHDFQVALANNIRHRLRRLGLDWPVKLARGRAYLDIADNPDQSLAEALTALGELSGVDSLAPALWLRPGETGQNAAKINRALIEQTMLRMARAAYRRGAAFAVRINRADKRIAMSSQAMAVWLGQAIRDGSDWDRVDLDNPDCSFYVDIYPDGMYFYSDKIPASGGLPVHTGGRVLSLLSGGIDSPVASYLMARRGCNVDLFHMSASHMRADQIKQSVIARLAARISCYTLQSKLYVVPYTHFDLALMARPTRYGLVLFRRFLLRSAARIAQQIGSAALVSGDSLGQVASQTLENLVSQTQAVQCPVLRPLIGFNKQEIIAHARRIGTYDLSLQPYKDCCTLLSDNPRTRSKPERLQRIEQALSPKYQDLIESTLADTIVLKFDCGELISPVHKCSL